MKKYLYFDWIPNANEFNDCSEEFDACGLCPWTYQYHVVHGPRVIARFQKF